MYLVNLQLYKVCYIRIDFNLIASLCYSVLWNREIIIRLDYYRLEFWVDYKLKRVAAKFETIYI